MKSGKKSLFKPKDKFKSKEETKEKDKGKFELKFEKKPQLLTQTEIKKLCTQALFSLLDANFLKELAYIILDLMYSILQQENLTWSKVTPLLNKTGDHTLSVSMGNQGHAILNCEVNKNGGNLWEFKVDECSTFGHVAFGVILSKYSDEVEIPGEGFWPPYGFFEESFGFSIGPYWSSCIKFAHSHNMIIDFPTNGSDDHGPNKLTLKAGDVIGLHYLGDPKTNDTEVRLSFYINQVRYATEVIYFMEKEYQLSLLRNNEKMGSCRRDSLTEIYKNDYTFHPCFVAANNNNLSISFHSYSKKPYGGNS
jgi:hypothetical protein